MHRSLSHLLSACVFAGATAIGTSVLSMPASADATSHYEPSFLRRADRALAAGHAEKAVSIIGQHSARKLKQSHEADAQGILCRAHLALNAPVEARQACQQAAELDTSASSWRFLNNLGAAELALGHYDAAELAFSRASILARYERAPRRNLSILAQLRESQDAASGERVAASN